MILAGLLLLLSAVPAGTGVCTDVVIRGYRKAGVDL